MTTFDGVARVEGPSLNRGVLLGGMLALLFSANTVFILVYSLAGVAGNSLFTGGFLVASEITILFLSFRRIDLLRADYLFGAFLFCIAASFATNGRTAEPNEIALLLVSLAAYPAFRFISISKLAEGRTAFIWTTGILVAIGTLITAQALYAQWYDPHGKPIVFGFSAAPTVFLGSFGFLLIALTTTPLTRRKTAIICAAIFLPIAVFAASQVRFTFIAIVGSLCLVAFLSRTKQRKYIALIALVVMAGICTGLVARSGTTKAFLSYVIEETKEERAAQVSTIKPPSCYLDVKERNSIAIRKALVRDAFYLLPLTGTFGFGLDSFIDISCMSMPIHNSALQGLVEFGWLGGIALIALVGLSLALLLPAARHDDDVKFVICSLAYIVMISLAHGRVSRDILLFALLGLTAGISETYRARQQTVSGGAR